MHPASRSRSPREAAPPRPARALPRAAALAAPLVALAPLAAAQAQSALPPAPPARPASAPGPSAPPAATLAPVVVTGSASPGSEATAPALTLGGDALALRRGHSLGSTLDGLPGVSSTYFGPNANRPVLRGLDGDRARLLSNGGASVDASAVSFDHATPIDPLAVERIELLRGPAALRYGGSAAGGVVNSVDNRIPKRPLDGVGGAVEARLGAGGDNERGGAALVEAGDGRRALHVDAFARETADLRVPRHTPVYRGTTLPETTRVRNSDSRTHGGAVGGALTFDRGHLGVAAETYDSRYGTVADPLVQIRMKRDRYSLGGEARGLAGPVVAVRGQLNRSIYQHREFGAEGVGTVFDTRGTDGRLELDHAPLGPLRGTLGAQAEDSDFSALGLEALVPSTRTRRQALFAVEELKWALGTLGAGARLERVKVESAGDADAAAPPRFGAPGRRDFDLRSVSLSQLADLAPGWKLAAAWNYGERAPNFYELYANGVHVGTGAFETGDPALAKERSHHLELGLQWKRDGDGARVAAYRNRFLDYVSLEDTGATRRNGGETLPVYAFRGVPARFDGFEAEARLRLTDAPAWAWQATGKVDLVRAVNLDTGQPLPRIAPLRALLGVEAAGGPWRARAEVDAAARQDRHAPGDTPTPGHVLVNLSLTRQLETGGTRALAFLRLDNVGDSLAYSASTVQTLRGLVPRTGRVLKAGLRVNF